MKNFYKDGGFAVAVFGLIVLSVIYAVYMYLYANVTFWALLPFLIITGGFTVGKLIFINGKTYQYFKYIETESEIVNSSSMWGIPLGIAIVDSTRRVIWFNPTFENEFPDSAKYGGNLNNITSLDLKYLKQQQRGTKITSVGRTYITGVLSPRELANSDVCLIYFLNISNEARLESELKLSKPVALIVLIDSYGETVARNVESKRAHIIVEIDKLVEDFFAESRGIVKKDGEDRFFVIIEYRYLKHILDEKFKLLNTVRNIEISERVNATFSIGVGNCGNNLEESEAAAKQALDLALGRGGDQVAVKTDEGFEFIGGVSKGVEKQTKVKSRIVSNMLLDLLKTCETAYIMGHRNGDMDSLGASVGLAAGLRAKGFGAYVVYDSAYTLAGGLADMIMSAAPLITSTLVGAKTGAGTDAAALYPDLFMSPLRAVDECTDKNLAIVVDTHILALVESDKLLNATKNIVVIDHHRQMENAIKDALIFHHDPYASSASEMVTEIVQCLDVKIAGIYADAILAGIMLDTKNFTLKTGVHTFEAAAYLRKLGADTANVRPLFSATLENYRRMSALALSSKFHRRCAIAATEEYALDTRTLAPQAADEMLKFKDVDASFVLYYVRNAKNGETEVSISARSLGALNVQIVMEAMGGGGHQTMAGAQLRGRVIDEAKEILIKKIDELWYSDR